MFAGLILFLLLHILSVALRAAIYFKLIIKLNNTPAKEVIAVVMPTISPVDNLRLSTSCFLGTIISEPAVTLGKLLKNKKVVVFAALPFGYRT